MARSCGSCGARKAMTPFTDETFPVDHSGATVMVTGLSGWRCGACGDVVFDPDSARRYAASGDDLVLHERKRQSDEIAS